MLQKAFATIRPIFRERGKINAEVTGRLTESLGGVRVVKGYHAEGREAKVFAGGVQRLLDNVMRVADRDLADEPVCDGADGRGGRAGDVRGRAPGAVANTLTMGDYMKFTMFLAFMIAPMFQVVNIGTQLTEALAGLDRTHEVLARAAGRRRAGTRSSTWRQSRAKLASTRSLRL